MWKSTFIFLALPPTSTDRDIDDVMMLLLAAPPILFANETMFHVVRVGGNRHRGGPLLDQPIKFLSVLDISQRDVHHQHNQLILWDRG